MAECLVSESARVRDGAAAGLPGAKVFRAQHPAHVLHPHARDRPRANGAALAEKFCDRPTPGWLQGTSGGYAATLMCRV